jgi:septum formation protein
MDPVSGQIVLGSRSPRRLELLSYLVPCESIVVVPPRSAQEAGFAGTRDEAAIERRLRDIAHAKNNDVRAQVPSGWRAVLTADTIIVAHAQDGTPVVLGQPPESDWQPVVRNWFHHYYLGRTHAAWTAVCVSGPSGELSEMLVRSEVDFRADAANLVDWYLSTGEPRGKAGGYALQGAGSLFVDNVRGSISNVVGLPLLETAHMLERLTPEIVFTAWGPPG